MSNSGRRLLSNGGAELGRAGVDGKFGPDTLRASFSVIDEDEEPEEKPAKTAICTANSYVNVRSGRGGDYRQYDDIGNVYKGETVKVLDKDLSAEYMKIVWQGGIGYAYNAAGKYFSFVGKADENHGEKGGCFFRGGKTDSDASGRRKRKIYLWSGRREDNQEICRSKEQGSSGIFSNGRLELLLKIADECEKKGAWVYPIHYAWDCSGLWWYGANKVKLYGDKTVDSTAAGVYANYCMPIKKSELRAGDLVFYRSASAGRITHMGIVGEDGVVYEAMSGYTGVVTCDSVDDRTAVYLPGTHKAGHVFKRSAWTHFGRPMVFV